jgi:hypothetical protein
MKGRLSSLGVAVVTLMLTSCAHTRPHSPHELDFFVGARGDNPWNDKIQNWQARHYLDVQRGAQSDDRSSLSDAYRDFTRQLRRQVVAETVVWVQELSRRYYRPDGDYDHWATLGEVIETGGDDCDGLDLLTFVLLRRLGFEADEIYRAIVVERSTGQHHMVTLWFEGDDRRDPLVLDPTGVVTSSLVRLSEVPEWEPIELFDENEHFAVVERRNMLDVADGEKK